jgi:phospholipase C
VRRLLPLFLVVAGAVMALAFRSGGVSPSAPQARSPIRHVIVVDMENRSFDNILGKLCAEHARHAFDRSGFDMGCDGATHGVLTTGERVPLVLEPDYGTQISHSVRAQDWAINGGAMDGFSLIPGCRATDRPAYGCLAQYDPLRGDCGLGGTGTCIPNIARYARQYAISDRTFEFRATPSWAGHMVLGSATIERFVGWNPEGPGLGWGCDSGKTALWATPSRLVRIPSCIPDRSGDMGPVWSSYTGPRARPVPTIFDRLQAAGTSWRIYSENYNWSICPTFWACRGSAQFSHQVDGGRIYNDLEAANLPRVSFVIPAGQRSGHPPGSMAAGDTWLGRIVSAVMRSAVWRSTAIFVTFDDCGCFYDHVDPWQYNRDWGIRVPLLIISPYAKPGYTDSRPATFASLLTYIERTFSLRPLNPCATVDAWNPRCTDDVEGPHGSRAYGYEDAFDYGQTPLTPVAAVSLELPEAERAWLEDHRGIEREGT